MAKNEKTPKSTATPTDTKPKKPKKSKDTKSGRFQIAEIVSDNAAPTPAGQIAIHPETYPSRRVALDYLRKAIALKKLSAEAGYAIIQVKEWDLRPEVKQVTHISF